MTAWRGCQFLMGWATLLQALELPALLVAFPRSWLGVGGIFRDDRLPLLQAAAAMLLLLGEPAGAGLGLLASLAVSWRFRGSLCGGADTLGHWILLALSLGWLCPSWRGGCLLVIAGQCLVSYLVAGGAKLGRREWRSGEALRSILLDSAYWVAPWGKALGRSRWCRWAAWGVMLGQLVCPLLVWAGGREVGLVCLCLGVGFHVANASLLGLHRFVWVWLAAYPAVVWVSFS